MATPLPTAKLPDLPDERFPASAPSPQSSGGSKPVSGDSSPRPAAEVPKTYASSFAAWWSQGDKHEELVMAEERLLRCVDTDGAGTKKGFSMMWTDRRPHHLAFPSDACRHSSLPPRFQTRSRQRPFQIRSSHG